MRHTAHRVFAASCFAAAIGAIGLACGSSSDSGGTGGSGGAPVQPVAQADFASKLADAVCSNVGKCCTDNGYVFDKTKCSALQQSIGKQSVDRASTLGDLTYDETAAGACLAQYQAIVAACVADKDADAALAKACNGIWTGTKAEGQPCSDSSECAGFADGTVDCAPGGTPSGDAGLQSICTKTAPVVHGASGEPCGGTCETTPGGAEDCSASSSAPAGAKSCWLGDGLYCDTTKYLCAALIAVGQPCTGMSTCVESAYCSAGTCTTRIATGSPCASSGLADPCQSGSWCNAGSKTCEALKADGESCTSFLECTSSRCNGGACIAENVVASDGLCGSK